LEYFRVEVLTLFSLMASLNHYSKGKENKHCSPCCRNRLHYEFEAFIVDLFKFTLKMNKAEYTVS